MRKLGFLALIPLSAGAIGLTVGALWLVGSSAGQRERFSSLEIAPADPVFYMAINTEPSSSQWIAASDVLGTLNAKEPLRDAIDEELLQFGLEFERDILPLAGDEGYIAITDLDAVANETGGFVAAFDLRDPAAAERIALDVAAQEGTEFTEDEYQGVTVREAHGAIDGNSNNSGAMSFVDKTMVVGSSLEDVTNVIDVIQGRAPSADGNERLQEIRNRQGDEFLVWGYFDMQRFLDWLESYVEESLPTGIGSPVDPEQVFEEARKYGDRLSFALTAVGDGVTFDSTLILPPDADRHVLQRSFEPELASEVPADTLAFLAGFDLYNQGYARARDQLGPPGVPSEFDFDKMLGELESEIGINLEDDLLSLMTGEFALALDVSDFQAAEPEVDVLAAADVSDPERVRDTVAKIGSYFEEQGAISVAESDSDGVELWSEAGSGEAVAWTVHDGSLVFGYPESSVSGFVDGVDESLAGTNDWKRTMELLPGDTTLVGYLSLSRVIEELRKMEQVEAEFEQSTEGKLTFDDLAAIRSLGMAITSFDDGYGFHLALLVKD